MAQTNTRNATLQGLQTERAGLLDGEATASHRTRHNEARKTALAGLDRARAALTTAQEESAAATARKDGALAEKNNADLTRASAFTDLDAALAARDLTSADLDALFEVPPDAVEALRRRLRELDDAVTSARATLASRRQDHTAALEGGLPEDPPRILAEKLAELETHATTRSQRMGDGAGRLGDARHADRHRQPYADGQRDRRAGLRRRRDRGRERYVRDAGDASGAVCGGRAPDRPAARRREGMIQD